MKFIYWRLSHWSLFILLILADDTGNGSSLKSPDFSTSSFTDLPLICFFFISSLRLLILALRVADALISEDSSSDISWIRLDIYSSLSSLSNASSVDVDVTAASLIFSTSSSFFFSVISLDTSFSVLGLSLLSLTFTCLLLSVEDFLEVVPVFPIALYKLTFWDFSILSTMSVTIASGVSWIISSSVGDILLNIL